jgi:hypothetical protein
MNNISIQTLRAAAAFVALLGGTELAHAQQPGTNIATPRPVGGTVATEAPAGAMAPQSSSLQAEPIIDAQTTSSSRPNRPLLITGAILLGGSYGASAIVAATSERREDEKLYYPVVGPWMDLYARDCEADHCSTKTLDQVLLVGSGVVQGLGALGLVLSVLVPETTTRSWYLIGNERLSVMPQVGRYTTGLGAVGRF